MSLFQHVSSPAVKLGVDGCKTHRAAKGYSLCKWRNAADAVPGFNPQGRETVSASQRDDLLVESNSTAQPAPCAASRSLAARGMKHAEIGSP